MTDVTPDAAKAAKKTADLGVQATQAATETLRATADTATEAGRKTFGAAQQGFTQAAAAGNQAFKDNAEKSLDALNELNAQGKRNLEAMVASATAATRAAEILGAQMMSFTKASLEKQVEAARAMTGARSVQEAVELQTSYVRTSLESYVAEMNKAAETLSAAVKDTMQPLNERATAMMESAQSIR